MVGGTGVLAMFDVLLAALWSDAAPPLEVARAIDGANIASSRFCVAVPALATAMVVKTRPLLKNEVEM